MARLKITGLEGYQAKLAALGKGAGAVAKAAVWAGAAVAADAMRSELEKVPTSDHNGKPWWGTPGHPARGPSRAQKQGLLDSLGITPVSEDRKGVVNAKVGFYGYNGIRSKQWPDGERHLLVARAVNSGTSFMEKNAFSKAAYSKSRQKAKQEMQRAAENAIKKITKG